MLKCVTSFLTAVSLSLSSYGADSVTESSRQIPLAYDVDVVVIGGTVRGVAAAQEAAKNGATVFLAAPRPYLGEDICGTYRLWLNEDEKPTSVLGKALFPNKSLIDFGSAAKFKYSTNVKSVNPHKDNGRMLTDGEFSTPVDESVQFNESVTIVSDLGTVKELESLHLLAFQRPRDFALSKVTIFTSDDKKSWSKHSEVVNRRINHGRFESSALEIKADLNVKTRYVKLEVEQHKDAERILLGELLIIEKKDPSVVVKAEKRVTTPMTIKKALDKALIDSGVQFLYGSYATDIIRDKAGKVAGVVMANRSGRQAVRAKVIIDATDRAVAARMTKADFKEFKPGKYKFSRIVLEGEQGKNAQDLGIVYRTNSAKVSYKVYEHTVELEMKDNSWTSFAKADQEARNLTWQSGQVAGAEKLFYIPTDTLQGKSSISGTWKGIDALPIDAFKTAKEDFLYVLSANADVSPEIAAKIVRPLTGIALGKKIGQAAAATAKSRTLDQLAELTIAGAVKSDSLNADVGEMLHGIRSRAELGGQQFVSSSARSLPIIAKYDTVIVGGGTGGAPAGVGAARGGAKTLVIEYLHGLGGVGTLGRISKYYHGNRVGFTKEIDNGVVSLKSSGKSSNGWNIENKMEWLRSEIVKAGGDVWFRSLGVGSVLKGNKFVGVVVVTPFGRGVVLANSVIDATGNAVVPAFAGLETQTITGEHISVQGTGLPPYTPGESYKNSDWTFTDDDDVLDMWRIHVVARKKYSNAFDQGQLIDTRARRRIIGDVIVSPMDIINKRVYPDVITVSKSNFDNHGFSSHSLFMITPPDEKGLVGNVPYRALLPKGYDGLLVTGLGMSAHGDAMPVMRMQPDVQNHGYAAGKASAMAAENGTSVRNINIRELQEHLVSMDIIPKSFVGAKDSYPIPSNVLQDAVNRIGKDYSGISKVLVEPKQALPMLQKAWSEAQSEDAKLRYAHVLGMIFDGTGSETLIKAINAKQWDKGWNFRGMGQFGATTSPLDNLIIALGRTGDKSGLPTVVQKLKELTPKSEFSHSRAVSIALESYRDPSTTKALADFLSLPGISGHSFVEIKDTIERSPVSMVDNSTRNNSLRELIVARALYRCGDYQGLGEKTLKAYAEDFRGHYAAHARSILKEGR